VASRTPVVESDLSTTDTDRLGSGGDRPGNKASLRRGFAVLAVAIREQPVIFALSTLGSLLFGALTVADAWVLGWATNNVIIPAFDTGQTDVLLLVAVVALFVAVALLRAVGVVGRRLGAGIMQYRMQATYRRRVTRQYLRLPLAWHHQHPTGQLLSNANADVEAAWAPIAPLPMAVGVIAMLVVAFGAMAATDLTLTIVGLLVFPAVFVVNLAYQRWQSPVVTRAQALRAEVSEVAHESFDGALVVKTLGREEEETSRFARKANQLRDANIAVGRIRGLFDPVIEALPNLGVLVVLLVGVQRLQAGQTDAGAVIQVAYLFTIVSFPIRAFGWLLGEFPRSVVGWDRVNHVLQATGQTTYGTRTLDGATGPAKLQVESVSFSYDGQPVLRDLSFSVQPGRTVAVVGATAAGKTTLMTLLARLVEPQLGRILLDGVDVRELAPGVLASSVALVPQQTFLFDDSVRDNVTLGLDLDDQQIWAALETAQAVRFVRRLPDGLDSLLGERGASLSGGQRQRLALARALVRRPRLLIMDDATSAVDPEVEARILAALRAATASGSCTVLVVAHRLATIALADEVLYVEQSHIADRGAHEVLLERSLGYRDLVTAYAREAERRAADRGDPDAIDTGEDEEADV
jgi:ABC-type multidrug transport system fused ATPase/permease subunit